MFNHLHFSVLDDNPDNDDDGDPGAHSALWFHWKKTKRTGEADALGKDKRVTACPLWLVTCKQSLISTPPRRTFLYFHIHSPQPLAPDREQFLVSFTANKTTFQRRPSFSLSFPLSK